MKLVRTRSLVTSVCVIFCSAAVAVAEVKPAALFSDHVVLQSGMAVPIWGTADPGEKVTVTLNGQTKSAHRRRRRQVDGATGQAQGRRPV